MRSLIWQEPKKVLSLLGARVSKGDVGASGRPRIVIAKDGRQYVLAAPTAQECSEWVAALRAQALYPPSRSCLSTALPVLRHGRGHGRTVGRSDGGF